MGDAQRRKRLGTTARRTRGVIGTLIAAALRFLHLPNHLAGAPFRARPDLASLLFRVRVLRLPRIGPRAA
jgi:hypothetical protein